MSYDIRKEEGLKHMNKELFFSTMDSLKGIKTVHLAGIGECFQHPDIFELLNYASRKVRDEVRVNTNGYAILSDPESFLRKLPDNIHLYVSFDGYHEDSNYEKSLNLLAKLLEWHGNTDTKITLNMRVESKEEETRNLIERYSRDVFRVSTLHCMMPLGDYFPIIVNRVLKWVRAKI
jgi:MoaA/NifB/PqqE/SkfB family radical SAM enzyme